MQEGDRPTFGGLVMALAAAYRIEVSEPLIEAYWMALDDRELANVRAAVRRAIREGGKWMPTPSDLRSMTGAPTRPYHIPHVEDEQTKRLRKERAERVRLGLPEPGWPAMLEAMKPKEDP